MLSLDLKDAYFACPCAPTVQQILFSMAPALSVHMHTIWPLHITENVLKCLASCDSEAMQTGAASLLLFRRQPANSTEPSHSFEPSKRLSPDLRKIWMDNQLGEEPIRPYPEITVPGAIQDTIKNTMKLSPERATILISSLKEVSRLSYLMVS